MKTSNTVTCAFSVNKEVYNAYKGIVVANGENVKGNLTRYMMKVIQNGTLEVQEDVDEG